MVSHGLADHGQDYLVTMLLFTKKGNLTTLMKRQAFLATHS
jgi:hypothetical protein